LQRGVGALPCETPTVWLALEAQCLSKSGDKLRGIRYFIQNLIFPSETMQIFVFSQKEMLDEGKSVMPVGFILDVLVKELQYLRRKLGIF
jgi:hypothetical protein